jgi:hypothetical protein
MRLQWNAPMGPTVRTLIAGLCLVVACTTPARAQPHGGSITGTVTDRLGGAVADAIVQLSGEGSEQTGRTDARGEYRFINLTPGEYRLTLSKPGFQRVRRAGLQVRTGDALVVTAVLDIEGVEDAVEVAERLRTAGTRISFTHEELARIPLARSIPALMTSVPGVVADRVNVGGSESHQTPQFVFRGTRMLDTVWTIDGVSIGDRQLGGLPGIYDADAFEQVQFAVPSGDITRIGNGLSVNMVVRSGTNQLRGNARGYFSGDSLQASNVRDDARGFPFFVTTDTADHTRQITEYGADAGGPLRRGRAWFWASGARQDVRVFRQSGGDERTVMTPATIKVNWRATTRDAINWLWLDHGVRRFGVNPSPFRAPLTARQHQTSRDPEARLHGLWKIEDQRTFGSSLVVSARYAHYSTGSESVSIGTGQAAVSPSLGETWGATSSSWSSRPQRSASADAGYFRTLGRTNHEIKFGGGWQRTDMFIRTQWPGDGVVAFDISPTDQRARIYREQDSRNRLVFLAAYVSDSISAGPVTIDIGLRYDHQRAAALPSRVPANPAFPDLVPGVDFPGMTDSRAWIDFSPRASLAYAVGDKARTIVRGSIGRFASQIVMGAAAQNNPAHPQGWIEYPWEDANGDRLVQPTELRADRPYLAFEGMNPSDRSSPVPSNALDPAIDSRQTVDASISIERQLPARVTATLAYHYSRHTNWPAFRWAGLTTADYTIVRVLSDVLPDGTPVNIPLYAPDAERIQANGSRRLIGEHTYYSTYHGVEASVVRRVSEGWMFGATAAWNNSRAFYPDPPLNSVGNPTPLDGSNGAQLSAPADPLVQGGQVAPVTLAMGGGGVTFLNSRWQVSANGVRQLPWSLEFGANLVGRQGSPSPYMIPQRLGLDGNRNVLLTRRIDTVRLDNLWNLDVRLAKRLRRGRVAADILGDLFNVLNSNAVLVRERNLRSPNFDAVRMTVSPRILRIGVRVTY